MKDEEQESKRGGRREKGYAKRLVQIIRGRNYSIRTEKPYLDWIIRFIAHHNFQDPSLMGAKEIITFLEYLELPVVLTRAEIKGLFEALDENSFKIMEGLLYECGMRLMECIRLRVQDLDFGYHQVIIRNAKSNKD